MRPKVILSVLVCLAFLLSLGVAVKDVKADAIMFPWITKSASVSTIISVVNTAGMQQGSYQPSNNALTLHYQYIYKNTTDYSHDSAATWLKVACGEQDFEMATSKNDIVSFDAAGAINGGKPLFNDIATLDNTSLYQDGDFSLTASLPRRAYLLVDNNTDILQGPDNTLYGEAIVLEYQGGGAWGYIAYNASGGNGTSQSDPLDFSGGDNMFSGNDLLGEVITNTDPASTTVVPEYAPVVLLNPNDVKTRFFVTPIDSSYNTTSAGNACSNDNDIRNQRKQNINTGVQLAMINQSGSDYLWVPGMFDNDENPKSFTVALQVVCTAAIDLDLLMDPGVYTSWKNSGHQAWTFVRTVKGTVNQDGDDCTDNGGVDAAIGKLEYTEASSTFEGNNVLGAVNNFIWLRNSYTNEGPGGLNMLLPIRVDQK